MGNRAEDFFSELDSYLYELGCVGIYGAVGARFLFPFLSLLCFSLI